MSYECIQSPPQRQAIDIGQCWTARTLAKSCHVRHPDRMCRVDCRGSGRRLFAGPLDTNQTCNRPPRHRL